MTFKGSAFVGIQLIHPRTSSHKTWTFLSAPPNTHAHPQHCSQLSICPEYRLALFFSSGTKKGTEMELQIDWTEAEGGAVFFCFFQGLFFMIFLGSWFIPVWSTSCMRRLTAEAAAFSSLKAGLFFDLAKNKLFTFTECTTLDGTKREEVTMTQSRTSHVSLFTPLWFYISRERTLRWTSRTPFVPAALCAHAFSLQKHSIWILIQRTHVHSSCCT